MKNYFTRLILGICVLSSTSAFAAQQKPAGRQIGSLLFQCVGGKRAVTTIAKPSNFLLSTAQASQLTIDVLNDPAVVDFTEQIIANGYNIRDQKYGPEILPLDRNGLENKKLILFKLQNSYKAEIAAGALTPDFDGLPLVGSDALGAQFAQGRLQLSYSFRSQRGVGVDILLATINCQ